MGGVPQVFLTRIKLRLPVGEESSASDWWEEPQGWREEERRQGHQDGSEGPGEVMDCSWSGHPVCPRLCPKRGEPGFSGSYLHFLLGLLQAFPKQLLSPWRPHGQIPLRGGEGQGVLVPLGPWRSLSGDGALI